MTVMALCDRLAQRLWDAEVNRTPCAPLTDEAPELTVGDAYRIQMANIERRLAGEARHGTRLRLVGRKIGLTSRAVQGWLGVDQPDFGCLLDDMAVLDGGTADSRMLLQPRVEGEVVFVLKRELAGPGVTAPQVMGATDFILPAIEVIDSRIADWKITVQDTIADNASSGLFVVGSRPVKLSKVDLRLAGLALRKNGRVASTGAGLACLGHPVNAVVWLANALGRLGTSLPAGQIILSGALCPVVPVQSGDQIEVEIAHLGTVSVAFQ